MIHQQNQNNIPVTFPPTHHQGIERMLRKIGNLIKHCRSNSIQMTTLERLSIDEAHNIAKLHGFTWEEIFMIEEEGAKAVRS